MAFDPHRAGAQALQAFTATAILAIAASADALAQPRTPQVQNLPATELSRAPYQQYVVKQSCVAAVDCVVNFNRIPLSSRLDIKNVSCQIEIKATVFGEQPTLRFAQLLVLNSNNSIATASTLAPVKVNTGIWSLNHAVSVFANTEQAFQVLTRNFHTGDQTTFLGCHISGQMVKLG